MRLIDADALKARIEKYGGIFERCRVCINGDCATCVIEHMDEIAPTVDAVPVVRCEDCRYMTYELGMRYCRVWCAFNDDVDDGYCNYGERRTE